MFIFMSGALNSLELLEGLTSLYSWLHSLLMEVLGHGHMAVQNSHFPAFLPTNVALGSSWDQWAMTGSEGGRLPDYPFLSLLCSGWNADVAVNHSGPCG